MTLDRTSLWAKLYRITVELKKIDKDELSSEEVEWLDKSIDALETLQEFVDMRID